MTGSGRTAVFVRDGCAPCAQVVQRLQTANAEFDLYMVGSRQDDARIREWAQRAQIDPARVRNGGFHRIAAKRAETRFSDWDRFWHEDDPKSWLLFGASASCTRFFEEEHPDSTAANYLASALYALQSSGALQAVLALAAQDEVQMRQVRPSRRMCAHEHVCACMRVRAISREGQCTTGRW